MHLRSVKDKLSKSQRRSPNDYEILKVFPYHLISDHSQAWPSPVITSASAKVGHDSNLNSRPVHVNLLRCASDSDAHAKHSFQQIHDDVEVHENLELVKEAALSTR